MSWLSGTLHSRFIKAFAVLLLPMMLIEWWAVFSIAHDEGMVVTLDEILWSALWPVLLYLITLLIASGLLHRLVLMDADRLRADMHMFRETGRLASDPDRAKTKEGEETPREIFTDLAQRKIAADQIADARLTQAEALQKEVFHRVSNNLQIIQSMVRLLGRGSKEAISSKELEDRILLLSLAHHARHRLDDVEMRPFSEALPALVDSMKSSSLLHGINVNLDFSRKNLPAQNGHSLLHLTGEVLRWIGLSEATQIDIHLTTHHMTILADIDLPHPDPMTARLSLAFAQELGSAIDWLPHGVRVSFADR